MGWTVPYNMPHRKDLILDRTKGWTNEDDTTKTVVTCLKHCYRGGIRAGSLWKVMEFKKTNKATGELIESGKFIGLDMLQYYPEGRGEGNWGYKDLDESCGPVTFSCPISYLDMVPDPGGYATEWRKTVRQAYAAKREKIASAYTPELGEVVNLKNGIHISYGDGTKEEVKQVRYIRHRPLLVKSLDGRLLKGFKKTWFINPKEQDGRTNNENHQHAV